MRHLKEKIQTALNNKWITSRKHPIYDLWIYNYSPICQYDKIWNDVTLQCRGLILDSEYNIHSRPFTKFFNYSELQPNEIPNEPFEAYTKLDGSLGILYWAYDTPFIATRGSFESEQAIRATKILHSKYIHIFDFINSDRTYLFEILYPENRIVVDYNGLEDLILIAVIDNETGNDLPLEDIGFPIVKRHDGINDIEKLKSLEKDNEEGFVVKFKSGFRCKLKFSEYVRLHKILTQTSNIAIWDCLRNNMPLDDLLDKVPDEFYGWVRQTIDNLNNQFKSVYDTAKDAHDKIVDCCMEEGELNRKKFAIEAIKSHKDISGIIFNILDGKDCNNQIWKMIRPEYSKPFKSEI